MAGFVRAISSERANGSRSAIAIELVGPEGSGKRTLAVQFAAALNAGLVCADAQALLGGDIAAADASERIIRVMRMAQFNRALVYWHDSGQVQARVWQALEQHAGVTIFGSTEVNPAVAHPLFANSKRYPALLAYAVEQTLLGNAAELKERSIGIEVFGRAPTYDANADPVVRITAGEVRKRLNLYYYDSSHAGELVVELPLGSYVPVFRQSEPAIESPSDVLESLPADSPQPAIPLVPSAPIAAALAKPSRFPWLAAGMLLIAGCAAGVFVGMRIHQAPPPDPPSNIDRFWEPVHLKLESDHLLPGRARKEHRHGLDQLL